MYIEERGAKRWVGEGGMKREGMIDVIVWFFIRRKRRIPARRKNKGREKKKNSPEALREDEHARDSAGILGVQHV